MPKNFTVYFRTEPLCSFLMEYPSDLLFSPFSAESQRKSTFKGKGKGGHVVVKTTVSPSPKKMELWFKKYWRKGGGTSEVMKLSCTSLNIVLHSHRCQYSTYTHFCQLVKLTKMCQLWIIPVSKYHCNFDHIC